MADYIRTNTLCQAYVHAEVDENFEFAVAAIQNSVLPLKAKDRERIRTETQTLIDNINSSDDVELVANELYVLIEEIPYHPTPGRKDPHGSNFIPLYRDNRRALLSSPKQAKTA